MAHSNGGELLGEQQKKLKQLVEDATDKGRELLHQGLDSAREVIEEKTAEFKKRAEEYGLDDAAENVKTYVKKNPWKSIGIAVVTGLVIGKLFSSSKE